MQPTTMIWPIAAALAWASIESPPSWRSEAPAPELNSVREYESTPSPVDAISSDAPPPWKDALLTAREAVWRDFFGAPDALAAVLTEDFIAINSGGPWRNRAETIADSREARAAGSVLTELVFPETRVQRYGDVAIIYTTYRFTVKRGSAEPTTSAGRATEMFRLVGSRWLHTGWHLDEAE